MFTLLDEEILENEDEGDLNDMMENTTIGKIVGLAFKIFKTSLK